MKTKTCFVLDAQAIRAEPKNGTISGFSKNQIIELRNSNSLADDLIVAVPRIVILELVQHAIEKRRAELSDLTKAIGVVKRMGGSVNGVEVDTNEERLRDSLVKKWEDEAATSGVKILEIPNTGIHALVERATRKVLPFGDRGIGFKDSMIWLSTVEAMRSMSDCNFIVVTMNTRDFNEESLRKELRDLKIPNELSVKPMTEIEVFIDEKFGLKLQTAKRDDKIRTELLSRRRELIADTEKLLLKSDRNPYSTMNWMPFQSTHREVLNYDVEIDDVISITPSESGAFEVTLNGRATPRYLSTHRETPYYPWEQFNGSINISCVVAFNDKTKSLNLLEVQRTP